MQDIARRLSDIGFRRPRPEPECWHVARVGTPAAVPPAGDPALSRALVGWHARLGDRRGPSPYQIWPATRILAAGRPIALD